MYTCSLYKFNKTSWAKVQNECNGTGGSAFQCTQRTCAPKACEIRRMQLPLPPSYHILWASCHAECELSTETQVLTVHRPWWPPRSSPNLVWTYLLHKMWIQGVSPNKPIPTVTQPFYLSFKGSAVDFVRSSWSHSSQNFLCSCPLRLSKN